MVNKSLARKLTIAGAVVILLLMALLALQGAAPERVHGPMGLAESLAAGAPSEECKLCDDDILQGGG